LEGDTAALVAVWKESRCCVEYKQSSHTTGIQGRDKMQTRSTSGRPVLLGLLAYWAGLLVAARNYPGGYDWPYTTISSLVYAERNPNGFLWARSGMVLCGMFGLYWTARLSQGSKRRPAPQAAGVWILGCGYLCMACCALLPEHSPSRAHDALALAAFLSLCVGTVPGSFTALYQSTRHLRLTGPPRLWAGILAGLALTPVLLAALAQGYVSHALPALPWVSPAWRARGVPVCLSFAFWEWVTCASLSLYLVLLSRTTAAELTEISVVV
jgi:hypothetical protein